jgi:hypothetical protein
MFPYSRLEKHRLGLETKHNKRNENERKNEPRRLNAAQRVIRVPEIRLPRRDDRFVFVVVGSRIRAYIVLFFAV